MIYHIDILSYLYIIYKEFSCFFQRKINSPYSNQIGSQKVGDGDTLNVQNLLLALGLESR